MQIMKIVCSLVYHQIEVMGTRGLATHNVALYLYMYFLKNVLWKVKAQFFSGAIKYSLKFLISNVSPLPALTNY